MMLLTIWKQDKRFPFNCMARHNYGCVNSIYRSAVCSSRSHGDAWQERTCCSQAPATTEVLKLNTYMGMTGQPFVRALYFQSAKKIIGKKSRM